MAKKLKVWLNNKLNKSLHYTIIIKFYRILVTELVFTFFVYKYQNHFEFPKGGKQSGANQRVFCGGGYGYFLEPHNLHLCFNRSLLYVFCLQHFISHSCIELFSSAAISFLFLTMYMRNRLKRLGMNSNFFYM